MVVLVPAVVGVLVTLVGLDHRDQRRSDRRGVRPLAGKVEYGLSAGCGSVIERVLVRAGRHARPPDAERRDGRRPRARRARPARPSRPMRHLGRARRRPGCRSRRHAAGVGQLDDRGHVRHRVGDVGEDRVPDDGEAVDGAAARLLDPARRPGPGSSSRTRSAGAGTSPQLVQRGTTSRCSAAASQNGCVHTSGARTISSSGGSFASGSSGDAVVGGRVLVTAS